VFGQRKINGAIRYSWPASARLICVRSNGRRVFFLTAQSAAPSFLARGRLHANGLRRCRGCPAHRLGGRKTARLAFEQLRRRRYCTGSRPDYHLTASYMPLKSARSDLPPRSEHLSCWAG
jgi:hypothetical protein